MNDDLLDRLVEDDGYLRALVGAFRSRCLGVAYRRRWAAEDIYQDVVMWLLTRFRRYCLPRFDRTRYPPEDVYRAFRGYASRFMWRERGPLHFQTRRSGELAVDRAAELLMFQYVEDRTSVERLAVVDVEIEDILESLPSSTEPLDRLRARCGLLEGVEADHVAGLIDAARAGTDHKEALAQVCPGWSFPELRRWARKTMGVA